MTILFYVELGTGHDVFVVPLWDQQALSEGMLELLRS